MQIKSYNNIQPVMLPGISCSHHYCFLGISKDRNSLKLRRSAVRSCHSNEKEEDNCFPPS